MNETWAKVVIVAVVLGFAFLFWLVEFKGVVPSEFKMGAASLKFNEQNGTAPTHSLPTPAPSTPNPAPTPAKPSTPAVAQNALSTTTPSTPATTSTPASKEVTTPSTTTPSATPSTTILSATTVTNGQTATTPKPTGFTARQALNKYFQYLMDGQPQAAWLMLKDQENGEKMEYSDYEGFWKAHTDVKWTVTKEYESGNFAWVDLTMTQVEDNKPKNWRYTFKRQPQNADLKPYGYWGVVGIEAH